MKCLTIRQPWATLIALGEKQIETRSWPTSYRGDLAIHAGMQVDKAICKTEPYQSVLARHGYTADNLPSGVILAPAGWPVAVGLRLSRRSRAGRAGMNMCSAIMQKAGMPGSWRG
ncbi:ASCH domain-containing protein [Paenibacillus sp. FSL R10-2736]|uniref:ASCH domain-containing protein n=1 Tax=Paenibacillus sp. FSL R10-2736 TaxID=2954692 RepID=UPI0030FBD57D